jgi:hypothetical protein
MYELDGNRRPTDPSARPCAHRPFGALLVVLGIALHAPAAFAPSMEFPSLDLLVLRSERVELVRVVSPRDTSQVPIFAGGRIVRYRAVTRLLGGGPLSGSVTVHVHAPEFVPLPGDTLLVFWELWNRSDFEDGTRHLTAINLTDLERSEGWPAVTSDCRVPQDRDSVLAIVVRRAAMVRARCPLGEERSFSLADFVEGRGSAEKWMWDGCEAIDAINPMSMNVLASPADAKLLPSCRARVARHLRTIRAEGVPVIRRAATSALESLDGESLR